MGLDVSWKTWKSIDNMDDKLSILFDIMVSTHDKIEDITVQHSIRLDKLEKDRGTLAVLATAGGSLIGVMVAIFVKWGFYSNIH